MISVFHGKNNYESWNSAQKKLNEYKGCQIVVVDEDPNVSFASLGLFGGRKVWFIKRFFALTIAHQNKIWEEIQRLSNLDIVFWEDKAIDKRLKLYKEMQKSHVAIFEFDPLKESECRLWLAKLIKSMGLNAEANILDQIIAKVGIDQFTLKNEIEKLGFYLSSISRSELFVEDLDLIYPTNMIDVWKLVEAFYSKDKKTALEIIDGIDFDGSKEIEILGSLASVLKNIYLVLNYRNEVDTISKEIGIHPFVLKNAKMYARNFSLSRVEKLYEQFLNLDFSFKRSEIEPKMGLGLLTISL